MVAAAAVAVEVVVAEAAAEVVVEEAEADPGRIPPDVGELPPIHLSEEVIHARDHAQEAATINPTLQ